MSWVTDYFADYERKRAEALAAAEREAAETGKELFDLERLEQLLNRRSRAREMEHRVDYYLLKPEMRTLAEYAESLLAGEPWDDTP